MILDAIFQGRMWGFDCESALWNEYNNLFIMRRLKLYLHVTWSLAKNYSKKASELFVNYVDVVVVIKHIRVQKFGKCALPQANISNFIYPAPQILLQNKPVPHTASAKDQSTIYSAASQFSGILIRDLFTIYHCWHAHRHHIKQLLVHFNQKIKIER